ncbi:MAG: thioredoxin family protein [Opitutales bacterium]|jgi:thiol:disulfide interchange protein/DsbC/DsbD-like thiol-disulfide interchange protein|nr:thioredoxin family protein [Opitutales bacterium]
MRLLALGLLSLFALLGDLGAAVRTKVDLVNLTPDVRAGEKALVALRYRCDPHFHIYWKNPGDAGASPTVEWTEKSGAEVGAFIWPGPKLLDQAGVMNFVYENETLILMEVAVPAGATGPIVLKGKAEWLECDDKGCWPHDTLVALTLKVGPGNTAYQYDQKLYPHFRKVISTTGSSDGKTLTVALPADRKLGDVWFPERNFVTPNATALQKKADGKLTFELKDATETLASGPLNFTTRAEDGGFVDINVQLGAAAVKSAAVETALPHAGGLEWLPWTPQAQAKALADGKIAYVDFTARWCATCQVNKRVYKQDDVAAALMTSGVVLLKADWTKKDAVIADELRKYGRTGIPLNVILKAGQPPAVLSEALTGTEVIAALKAVSAGKAYQAETTTHAFGFWLLLAFGGGVLLNLMPCVFPMIGLKVLGFAKEAGAARRTVVLNGLLYSTGVVASFLALALLIIGLKSGGNSVGWGFQMQSPGFVLGTCVLMIVLGLSLAGVFEIGVGLGGVSAGDGDGRVATFLSGVLATVVATPCTAPGLGAALGFALDKERSTGETLLFFVVIGLGMALPYLLLSLFPRLAAMLPRPGEWMESLKQGMSFPLFAYALYLLWVLNALVEDAAWVRDASLGLALIATSCWILGRWGALHRTDNERLTAKLVAGALFVGTLAYLFATLP